MQPFLDQMDAIYCLCLPQRKSFVLKEAERLGIDAKIIIVDAFTCDSLAVSEVIKNHQCYPILSTKIASIACTLGIQYIMQQIVKDKHTFAMILEDDVYFPDHLLKIANTHINRTNIAAHFDVTLPYNLYLQSAVSESSYKASGEGIVAAKVTYGEPAYITNHQACSLLLRYLFPITAPFDEYKKQIKQKCVFNEAIIIPYPCRELSANCHRHSAHFTFVREIKQSPHTLQSIMNVSSLCIDTPKSSNLLLQTLVSLINPTIKCVNHSTNHQMIYSINQWEKTSNNRYLLGATLTDLQLTHPAFIISVRGAQSASYVYQKYQFYPPIGNILSLYRKFLTFPKKVKIDCLFIYSHEVKIKCDCSSFIINLQTSTIPQIIENICQTRYVITDLADYVTLAHSYGIKTVYAVFQNIDLTRHLLMVDYYSTFNYVIEPLILKNDNLLTFAALQAYPQPTPLNRQHLDMLIDIMPFRFECHQHFKKSNTLLQIYH